MNGSNGMEIAETLVEQVKKTYAADIALIAYYGSYALGKAGPRSDLDFFFIPATPNGYKAALQFIVDGIGYDFWPISWERAERMSMFLEPMATIIADCKVMHARSPEDLERFKRLQGQIAEKTQPPYKKTMQELALQELKGCYAHLHMMNRPETADRLAAVRMEACHTVTKVLQSLSLFNQTYFKRGWGQNLDEIESLPLKPEGLDGLLRTITENRDPGSVRRACSDLVEAARSLIVAGLAEPDGPHAGYDAAQGFYEEAKSTLNKIITACEKGDYDAAFFSAAAIQHEIGQVLALAEEGVWHTELSAPPAAARAYERQALPDLLSLLEPERLDTLRTAVTLLDEQLLSLLEQHGVKLNRFRDAEDFRHFIRGYYRVNGPATAD